MTTRSRPAGGGPTSAQDRDAVPTAGLPPAPERVAAPRPESDLDPGLNPPPDTSAAPYEGLDTDVGLDAGLDLDPNAGPAPSPGRAPGRLPGLGPGVGPVTDPAAAPDRDRDTGPAPDLDVLLGEQRQLINIAYRLLGSLAEAEDAVQEAYARWYAMSPPQREAVRSPGAWLTTVTSRICLNLLGSARARRETYVGEWLPEPLPDRTEWLAGRSGGTTADPADRVTLDESVALAFLVVLESMTPAERVAFILHDVFCHSFAEVAEIVGRTPAACRQLASSARRRVRASQPPATPAAQRAGVVKDFKQAWEAKDIDALIGLLDPGATMTADGGGLATAFLDPITGGERIAHAWLDIGRRRPAAMTFLERTVNGQPGLVAQQDGVTVTVFAFAVAGDRITHIWVVRNPEKLRPWTRS
jgi:RNA polymerase sigma-70 factor, ECF subfamily